MKRSLFAAAAIFSFAALTVEAFDDYDQAVRAGIKAQSAKKNDEAVKCYEEAVSLTENPGKQHKVLIRLTELYWKKNDPKSAFGALDRIIRNEKMNTWMKVDALTRRGNYNKWRNNAEADRDFRKALALKPSGKIKHELLNSYADLLIIMKKYPEAESLLKEAETLERSPDYLIMYTKLGLARIAAAQKKYDEARELYLEVIKNPDALWWQRNDGYSELVNRVYLPQNKTEDALKILKHAEKNSAIPKQGKKWIIDSRIRALYIYPAQQLIREKKFDQASELLKDVKDLQKASKKVKQEVIKTKEDIELYR